MLWPWGQGWCNWQKTWPDCDAEAVNIISGWACCDECGESSVWRFLCVFVDVRNWGHLSNACNFQRVFVSCSWPIQLSVWPKVLQSWFSMTSDDIILYWEPEMLYCPGWAQSHVGAGHERATLGVPLLCAKCLSWVEFNVKFSSKVPTSPLQKHSLFKKRCCG